MIRARFKVPAKDPRPVSWPIPHPYWVTGQEFGTQHWWLVAYADSVEQIMQLWPDAQDIDSDEAAQYVFTSRFPRPDWMFILWECPACETENRCAESGSHECEECYHWSLVMQNGEAYLMEEDDYYSLEEDDDVDEL